MSTIEDFYILFIYLYSSRKKKIKSYFAAVIPRLYYCYEYICFQIMRA